MRYMLVRPEPPASILRYLEQAHDGRQSGPRSKSDKLNEAIKVQQHTAVDTHSTIAASKNPTHRASIRFLASLHRQRLAIISPQRLLWYTVPPYLFICVSAEARGSFLRDGVGVVPSFIVLVLICEKQRKEEQNRNKIGPPSRAPVRTAATCTPDSARWVSWLCFT